MPNKNVEIMISLPTFKFGQGYFNDFTAAGSDGRGRIGDAYRHVAIHSYADSAPPSADCLLKADRILASGTPGIDPLVRAKQVTNGHVYITETAINSRQWDQNGFLTTLAARYGQPSSANFYANARWAELGRRYVKALEAFDTTDGRIKGATFFQTDANGSYQPGTLEPYNIDEGTTTGDHAHWAMGNRARNTPDCDVSPYVTNC